MPEIIPMLPEGTMTLNQNTQMPSRKVITNLTPPPIPDPAVAPVSTTEVKPEPSLEPSTDQKRIRALLYKEKQLQGQRRKIEEDRKALDQARNDLKHWMDIQELAKTNKLAALEKTGITYDELTQQILNNGQIPPAQVAATTAEEIVQKKLEAYEKRQKEEQLKTQTANYQQAMKQLSNEVKYAVETTDKYPLVKQAEAYDDITKEIESEFHRTGRIIPVEEALQRWESDALEGLAELTKLEKVRSKVSLESKPQPNQEISPPTTLTQRATASIPSPKPMTNQERRQRAIDAFYGRIT